jgi:Domain of unknown function (DUF543)
MRTDINSPLQQQHRPILLDHYRQNSRMSGRECLLATSPSSKPSSEEMFDRTIQYGLEAVLVQGIAGFVVGGLLGLVVSRRHSKSAGMWWGRMSWAGLGAGIGMGSAWTRTSMELEQMLGDPVAAAEPPAP